MTAPTTTPGEWEFVEGEPGFMGSLEEPPEPPYPPTVFVSNDKGDFELAQLVEPVYFVESEDEYGEGSRYCGNTSANGRLMAAAPELLRALEVVLPILQKHALPVTYDLALAAINKATTEVA